MALSHSTVRDKNRRLLWSVHQPCLNISGGYTEQCAKKQTNKKTAGHRQISDHVLIMADQSHVIGHSIHIFYLVSYRVIELTRS